MGNKVTKGNIRFDFEEMRWRGITVDQIEEWEKAYPLVSVVDEIANRMVIWLEANPRKAKKKLWKKFITNWLSRKQERYEQFRR